MTDQYETCAAQHFGMWAVKPAWLSSMASAYNAGTLPKVVARADGGPLYGVDSSGVAFVSIHGQILKGESSFGGVSSTRTRQALRAAESDSDVRGIMILIDSPGGTVAGTQNLADEVARISREGRKLIVTHAEDAMHSAALWVGVQASRVTASAMTEVGSIGVLAVLQDTSKMAEDMGVKVHVVSTGDAKGAGVPGTEITDAILADVQSRVDEINAFFLKAVKDGRGMGIEAVRALVDGGDWLAAEAKDKGLIDAVMSQDDAVRTFRAMIRQREADRAHAADTRRRAIKLAGMS